MPRTTPSQKLSLSLRLLVGLKHPAIREALRVHGFSRETLDEGWALLVAAGREENVDEEEAEAAVDSELVAFQKRWFPVARIVLRAHLGDESDELTSSFQVQNGLGSSLSVSWFLSRLTALAESPSEKERELREVLRARGLTDEIEREARALLSRSSHVIAAPVLSVGPVDAGALAALWTWYLEWQGFVRVSISNKNLLRSLGLATGAGRPAGVKATPVRVLREGASEKKKFLTQRGT